MKLSHRHDISYILKGLRVMQQLFYPPNDRFSKVTVLLFFTLFMDLSASNFCMKVHFLSPDQLETSYDLGDDIKTFHLFIVNSSAQTHVHAHNTQSAQVSSANLNAPTTTVSTITSVSNELYAHLAQVQDAFKQRAQKLLSTIRKHPIKTILGVTAGCYGTLALYTAFLASRLQKNSWWSSYKTELSLDDLYKIEDTELTHDLLAAIQQRHGALTTLDESLKKFFSDIDTEVLYARRYLAIIARIRKLHLSLFFPINNILLESLPERVSRVLFLKSRIERFILNRTIDKSK